MRCCELIAFFTAGEATIAQSWHLRRGLTAWHAAGQIDTDIQQGFVRAEVIGWRELIDAGGYAGARERGTLRVEGRDYAMNDGDVITIKFSPSARRCLMPPGLELSHAEEAYLCGHRALLGKLMAALRTERDVRLAVLFGSTATGEDTPVSDVDLLIVHRRSGGMVQAGLCIRLQRALGTPVDVVTSKQAEAQPSLLADVMREGRVLVDRDDLWGVLQERRDRILAAGAREDEQIMIDARATFAAARERLTQHERGTGAPGIAARA